MAREGKAYPGFTLDYEVDIEAQVHDQEARMRILVADGKVVRFPVADGYACYFVESTSPLVLRHIDYIDGYRIQPAMMRGLRLKDIQFELEREASLQKLFTARNSA